MTEHTPTPWTAMPDEFGNETYIVGPSDHAVADCQFGYGVEDDANAALIVKAVNEYVGRLKSCPAQRQSPSADTIAGIMIRDMFAPHELPLDEELTGKYQALAAKILASLAPQPAMPVGWRVKYGNGDWVFYYSDPHKTNEDKSDWEAVEPLYAAPSPALDPATVEACAKVVDQWTADITRAGDQFDKGGDIYAYANVCQGVAAAIRALLASPAPSGEPVSSTYTPGPQRCCICDETIPEERCGDCPATQTSRREP